MKKITILALNLDYGGIEKYISNLSKVLEDDFIVEIICTYKFNDKPAFEFSDKVKIKYLVNGNPKGVSLKKLVKTFKVKSICVEISKRIKYKKTEKELMIKYIKNIETDYLISTRISQNKLISKYLTNSKVITIATEHNHHRNNRKYINGLVKSIKDFDFFVLPTKELYDFYQKMLLNVKCLHISNSVPFVPNKKSTLKEKNIISVGRFSEEKGLLDMIDVFKIINNKEKNIKLYLIGDGYQRKQISKKIKKLNLEEFVVMPGFIKEEDQKKYYMDSSLYLMTSYTEAFGLVLIESMSYGVPCIAFDSASGPKEILAKGNGILIKNRNKDLMAKTILELLNNNNKLKSMQKKSNEIIKQYAGETFKKNWLKLLQK